MPTDRQIDETIARCVSTMVYLHASGQKARAFDQAAAEIQLIAAWIREMGLEDSEVQDRILDPLEEELCNRYGPELGPRLLGVFLEAYDGFTAVVPAH